MGWPMWAILLTAAGAFLLLNLLRNQEETRRRRRPMPGGARGPEDSPEGKRQSPATDLDRFLQEVHRRRRATEGEEAVSPQRRPAPAVRPRVASPARVSPVPGRRPTRSGQRPSPRTVSVSPATEEAIPDAIAVDERVSTPSARSGPEPSATVFPASRQPLAAVRAVQSVEASRTRAGKDKSFLALLSSRQALRNAIVLREVLGPPVCKRVLGRRNA